MLRLQTGPVLTWLTALAEQRSQAQYFQYPVGLRDSMMQARQTGALVSAVAEEAHQGVVLGITRIFLMQAWCGSAI